MEDSPRFSELADLSKNLTQIEFIWLLGWNIADGRWGRIGLDEAAGRDLLVDLFSKLHSGLDVVKQSSGRLQQRLMSLRRGTFEEIQEQAPFSVQAQRNMEAFMRAWKEDGEAGFAKLWERVFPVGRDAAREPQAPIRIIGEGGDSEECALEVLGAPDPETRAAAEWWYKFYTFGPDWKAGLHLTTTRDKNGARYSAHEIDIPPDIRSWIYFRLPW